jgi:hypothetical protein
LFFGKNFKNTPPTIWQKTWHFFWQLGKNLAPTRKYMRVARGWHRGFHKNGRVKN